MKIMQGTIMGGIDGVRVLMKAGSKPPPRTRVSYFGPPCSRCGSPSQIREHDRIVLDPHFELAFAIDGVCKPLLQKIQIGL